MPAQASQPQVRTNILKFLRSFLGIARILQIVFGAGLWITIAANKYEGSVHFVLFVAVLFWLLTLALFFVTLLDKQDLVPLLGGDRWLYTNLAHDVAAAVLYLPAIGVLIYKTDYHSFCNLELYQHFCPYKVYLTAAVFACLCCVAYLLSIIYGACRKCRGEQTVI
ncbi:MARVEL domain-containing protein 1 [Cynoglossus semilaevis]|uniref:MARVEL domain-containing protein 1 n=1 Tax=Cynoglossus semilaevis TaxID=244447 RepID=UPI0004960F91|nr:MARVEL domain-containing protein 1 [Cynoglossus semilaevis]